MSRILAVALFSWLPMLAFPALAPAAEITPEPLPALEAARTMRVPPGFHVSLVAAEPDVVQPISFAFDDRGRMYVAEAMNYGAWQPTGSDRVVILEDTDGDGRAETRKVFYEGLNYVTGIEVGFGGVYAISPPCLYFIPDRDGDDRADGEPLVLFDGFGHKESRHNLATGFTWGPDGWLYAGHGRTSPSDVGRPGTPEAERIHCDGGVYRIHPTRLVFENFADGTTNPWGVDFDDFGQCFVSNCVNPHLFHMIQGGHYEPWRNRPSSKYAYARLPTCADHLHWPGGAWLDARGGRPEVLALGGGHAHCGTLVYLGDNFPAEYRNTVFMANVHGRRLNNDVLRRRGSGYVATHGPDFMLAADPWFMGVTLRAGPDGAMYVSDWSDTGECHTYKPQRHTGRVYRISYGPPRPVEADLAKASDLELAALQRHRNEWHVRHARRLLQERAARPDWKGQAVHAALGKQLAGEAEDDVPRRLRGLWALHATGGMDPSGWAALLDDESEHVRGWAIQLLCERGAPDRAVLARFAEMARGDASPVVRLYLACAARRLPIDERWAIVEGLVTRGEDADDANLPLLYWYAIEPLVAADKLRALKLLAGAKIPLVRQYIARRAAE
jgi:putative membrane-bound dehydrogenase-like protein